MAVRTGRTASGYSTAANRSPVAAGGWVNRNSSGPSFFQLLIFGSIGVAVIVSAGTGWQSDATATGSYPGASQAENWSFVSMTGIRSCTWRTRSFAAVVRMVNVSGPPVGPGSQTPANANGTPSASRNQIGAFFFPTVRHSMNPSAGTRQRRFLIASWNVSFFAAVSHRALGHGVGPPGPTSPHVKRAASRAPSGVARTTVAGWLGAKLYRGE